MIKVSLSFDDSVNSVYNVAYPILKEEGLPFTINVITDNIEKGIPMYMTVSQLTELHEYGAEIACHGHTHKNTRQDVQDNIVSLAKMGLVDSEIGFASPNSEITQTNGADVKELLNNGILTYIRTGTCVRREGLLYAITSYIERITHSKFLFYILNKRNIIKNNSDSNLFMSVAVTKHTTTKQIMYLLNKIEDGTSVILMFHHIVADKRCNLQNTWSFSKSDFYNLCKSIKCDPRIDVITTINMAKEIRNSKI